MALLRLLVFCALAACCVAHSLPAPPLPKPPGSNLLRPRICNDSDVLAVAGFALHDINTDRKDGYVFSLSRVHDAWEHFQEDMGSLFYLKLDVLETGCHVLSKKAWKECNPRNIFELAYGQCKAMFHINKPRRVLYLLAYNCTILSVTRRHIDILCPDCPGPIDLSDPKVIEAATESLAKFNSENPSKQYSVVKVTRANGQWVAGSSYFVDYLIKESPCTESQASCSLQPSDSEVSAPDCVPGGLYNLSALTDHLEELQSVGCFSSPQPVGLCHGSLVKNSLEKLVSVKCDFFESKAQAPGGEKPAVSQEPKKLPQKNADPTSSPSLPVPRGYVQHSPDLGFEEPGDAKEPLNYEEAYPVQLNLTTNPQGDTVDVSFLYLEPEEKKLEVLPFPGVEQRSVGCPGPAKGPTP